LIVERGGIARVRVVDEEQKPRLWMLEGFEIVAASLPSAWEIRREEDGTLTFSVTEEAKADFDGRHSGRALRNAGIYPDLIGSWCGQDGCRWKSHGYLWR